MQTPPPGSTPSNYPRPHLTDDRQVLRDVATAQRQIIYCILGQIVYVVINRVGIAADLPSVVLLDLVLAVIVFVATIFSVARLAKALSLSQVLYVILMFVPCVSLLVLVSLSSKASAILSQAGIKVGLMGVNPNSI